MQVFENLEKRKKRSSQSQGAGAEEPKQEGPELEEDRASPPGPHAPQSGGVGVSTRRASYVTVSPLSAPSLHLSNLICSPSLLTPFSRFLFPSLSLSFNLSHLISSSISPPSFLSLSLFPPCPSLLISPTSSHSPSLLLPLSLAFSVCPLPSFSLCSSPSPFLSVAAVHSAALLLL